MVDMIITGIGGQGTVSVGHLIAETLNEMEIGFLAAETHGMSQRGGSVIFHLRIEEGGANQLAETKFAPLIEKQQADIILSGEPMEALRAMEYLRPDGIIITDSHGILSPVASQMGFEYPDNNEIFARMEEYTSLIYKVPASDLALEMGQKKIANIILLGTLLSLDLLPLSYEVMKQKIITKWPKFVDFNLQALDKGYNINSRLYA